MPLVTLKDVLTPALANGHAVAGLVVLGWEDARAYAMAAQAEGVPVILQAGPGCRAHTPLPVLAAMFRTLAHDMDTPVVAHLDHGYTFEECREAIDAGFTSVMYDGSRKALSQNIEKTAAIVEMARKAGVSVEGEVGFVGYADGGEVAGEASARSDPDEVAQFVTQTGVDAVAVSVGNEHLQQSASAEIDRAAIAAIEAKTNVPLVIHGGSGVPAEVRQALARDTAVCKFNIGTELRMAFGKALRQSLADQPNVFDRNALLKPTEKVLMEAARPILRGLA
ncbi:MAG: class II fructose-bisphosphate aldolase [Pseudomonadota bacterium]